jgi:pimeloyl-ACP methyl ester carboxylesterase
MTKIKVSDVLIAYEQHGSGYPILFIHGYPLHRGLWQDQWIALADTAQVIVPDLRGHGESGSSSAPHTMDNFAHDCFDLLDKLAITKPPLVCGLSMGGYIAMAMLRMHPERIAGLILTATRSAADTTDAKVKRDKTILLAQTQGAQPIIDSMLPYLLSPITLSTSPGIVETVKMIMASISVNTIVKDLQGLRDRLDSTALLTESRKPTLILHGADDQIVPKAEAQALQHAIPDAELVIIPDAGHLPNLEQPQLFNTAIRQFIRIFIHE